MRKRLGGREARCNSFQHGLWAESSRETAGHGPIRGVGAGAPARLRTGRPTLSHTHTCPGPPRSSPAPHARGLPRGPAGRPGRRAGRWPLGPPRTRAAPWGSRRVAPGPPPAGARPLRAAAGPGHSRSRGGRGHCRTAGLRERELRAGGAIGTGRDLGRGSLGTEVSKRGGKGSRRGHPALVLSAAQREGPETRGRRSNEGPARHWELRPPSGRTGRGVLLPRPSVPPRLSLDFCTLRCPHTSQCYLQACCAFVLLGCFPHDSTHDRVLSVTLGVPGLSPHHSQTGHASPDGDPRPDLGATCLQSDATFQAELV